MNEIARECVKCSTIFSGRYCKICRAISAKAYAAANRPAILEQNERDTKINAMRFSLETQTGSTAIANGMRRTRRSTTSRISLIFYLRPEYDMSWKDINI